MKRTIIEIGPNLKEVLMKELNLIDDLSWEKSKVDGLIEFNVTIKQLLQKNLQRKA